MSIKPLAYALSFFWAFGPAVANAQSTGSGTTALTAPQISTAEIATQTTAGAVSCMGYKVIGVCVWLTYDYPAEFGIDTTTRVGHYIPDVVVSSFLNTGKNPWTDIQSLTGAVSSAASGMFGSLINGFVIGGGNSINADAPSQDSGRVKFKNVEIVGNPTLEGWGADDMRCGTVATMMQPYYVSDADMLAWRFGIPEMSYPPAYLTYLRNIGKGLTRWGSVYPRTGSLVSNHDYKAGAVMAQRAGDFVTREDQPHVYTTLYEEPGMDDDYYTWPPPPLKEGDEATGWWQMLLPHAETSCYVFADVDDSLMGPIDPNVDRINPFEDYVWNLWRPYTCCERPDNGIVLLVYTGTFP